MGLMFLTSQFSGSGEVEATEMEVVVLLGLSGD